MVSATLQRNRMDRIDIALLFNAEDTEGIVMLWKVGRRRPAEPQGNEGRDGSPSRPHGGFGETALPFG